MDKRIVLALGGNALGDSLKEQMLAVKSAASVPPMEYFQFN